MLVKTQFAPMGTLSPPTYIPAREKAVAILQQPFLFARNSKKALAIL
jgi:hypothetical protein